MTPTATSHSDDNPPGPTLAEFESLEINAGDFDHEAHLYVAWCYLQQFDLLASIERYRSVLIRLTQKLGVPEKFHETITWFYLVAVAEHATGEAATDWEAFKGRNPQLFARSPSIIRRFYSEDRLMSEEARKLFVLPDLSPYSGSNISSID
jgi:hypothetical protein